MENIPSSEVLHFIKQFGYKISVFSNIISGKKTGHISFRVDFDGNGEIGKVSIIDINLISR